MNKRPKFIESILGAQLSSVEFVQDYVQLHFDGPTLTLFVWPIITRGGQQYRRGQTGCYRDELCDRIGRKVLEVVTDNADAITIRFDDATSFAVSLKDEDRTGPETGYFSASRDPSEPLLDF